MNRKNRLEVLANQILAQYFDKPDEYPIISPRRMRKIARREIPSGLLNHEVFVGEEEGSSGFPLSWGRKVRRG